MDIIIVDDEPLARDRLRRMLSEEAGYRVVAQAANAEETMAAVLRWDPDLVLLDIQMPGDSGLEAAAGLAALEDPPTVIFCTAYQQYALDAFAVNAQNYLLKPVRKDQLLQALDQAQRLNRAQRQQVLTEPAAQGFGTAGLAAVGLATDSLEAGSFETDSLEAGSLETDSLEAGDADTGRVGTANRESCRETRSHITARTRRGLELIPLDRVFFFAADQKYVTVYHKGGETLIDDTLKELEQEFGDRFVRTHRGVLVALERVEAMEKNRSGQFELRLAGTDQRPAVSRRHATYLRELLSRL